MRVALTVLESYDKGLKGKVFSFEEADRFFFGKTKNCQCLLSNDPYVSRNHFMLEIAPPEVRLHDLGSKNGTRVNGKLIGGHNGAPVVGAASRQENGHADLHHGDKIQVGETILTVEIVQPVQCLVCDTELEGETLKAASRAGDYFLCKACSDKKASKALKRGSQTPTVSDGSVGKSVCSRCGRDLGKKGEGVQATAGLCEVCLTAGAESPKDLLADILGQGVAKIQESFGVRNTSGAPEILDYQLGKELGAGGMGKVYLARHKRTAELVAVKVMLAKIAPDERARKIFEREIDIAGKLSHENIMRFLGRGNASSLYYFVLEYAEGGSVQNFLERKGGKVSLPEALAIMLPTLAGLRYAHASGFVHRDLKPANILLVGSANETVAKIADFGLARSFEKASLSGLTRPGDWFGTLPFMPREQMVNYRDVKPVSDVFAMGATLYTMLTGEFVYDFSRSRDKYSPILEGSIIPIEKRDAGLPAELARVIGKATSPDTKQRYQTAAEFERGLRSAAP